MTIGEKIKKRRIELNLTLTDVANEVGVVKSTINKWENGSIDSLKLEKIRPLAKVLKVSPYYFLYSDDSEVPTDDAEYYNQQISFFNGISDPTNNLGELEKELINVCKSLTTHQKVDLLAYAYKIKQNYIEK